MHQIILRYYMTIPLNQREQHFKSLLRYRQVAPFVQRQKEVRKQTAAQFNLFEALGIARNEQYQSRFLAFFLNPTESHDQGGLFLRTFLEHIQLTEIPLQPLDRTVVKLKA